jgi:peptidoglycan/LPS O-acetylase OafA/YrhL
MKRTRQLDMLRAVAVLLVIGSHVTWNPILSRLGWTGVDLFFCLSGFLISGLLFRDFKASGKIHWRRFLVRRGFKLYPAYYALIVGSVIFFQFTRAPILWKHLWPDLIFVQDYKAGTWGHLWSLGIEEQFYLLLPLCLWLMVSGRHPEPFRRVPWFCGFVAVACLAMRAVQFYGGSPFLHESHMRPFHLRCDSLSFGVLLGYLQEFRPKSLKALVFGRGRFLLIMSLVCIATVLLFTQETPFMYVFGLTLLYLGYGGILLYSLSCLSGEGRVVRWSSQIGQFSYSIYLWHLPVAWLSVSVLHDRLHWGRNPVFAIYMLSSVAVGIGMSHAIERPGLRLREKLFPDIGQEHPGPGASPVTLPGKCPIQIALEPLPNLGAVASPAVKPPRRGRGRVLLMVSGD